MAENKVVIKINYDKDKIRKVIAEPKMVTVWHTQRIVAALLILALIVIAFIYWLSGDNIREASKLEQKEQAEMQQPLNTASEAIKEADVKVNENPAVGHAPVTMNQGAKKDLSLSVISKRPAAIIYDKKVIRASLNSGLKDKEPYEQVKLPIRLAQNQTIELFYFNELRNIKDGVLYHYWLKDGRVVDKKPLSIKDSRAKVLSAKTLSYKDKGEWQIQLVDRQGKVFSQVNFLVNPE